jgi:hypothetical protein
MGIIEKWTEQQGKIARRMAEEGNTAAEIGAVVKKTRNAVLGYLNRNGIRLSHISGQFLPRVPRKQPVVIKQETKVIHRKVKPKTIKPPRTNFETVQTGNGVIKGVPFMKSGPNQCRYMIETRPPIICGEPTKSLDCSWCEDHYEIVFVKPEPRSRTRSKDSRTAKEGLGGGRSSHVANRGF